MDWAAEELAYTDLGDRRRKRRLIRTVTHLANHPMASVPEAQGTWAATKGTYRLWSSQAEAVTPQGILASHQRRTVERIAALGAGTLLAVQDTTTLDLTGREAQGLGSLDGPDQRGLKVHSVLAVSEDGRPLGVLSQQVWARPLAQYGQRATRRQRTTAHKESQRWLDGFEAAQQALPGAVTEVVTVADREGDLYALFSAPRAPQAQLLIRAGQLQRRVQTAAGRDSHLRAAGRVAPVAGTRAVEVRRQAHRPARVATLTVRYTPLTLLPPHSHATGTPEGEAVVLVWAHEAHPPAGQAAIDWWLLTTLAVAGFAQAARCVRLYSLRWVVERFHFTLKSGWQVEQLQLETADGFMRALATYSLVAWHLLWLTYEARVQPDQPCDRVLTPQEWSLLVRKFSPSRGAQPPPPLHQAVHWIAQLGGFLARTHDGEPGVKTIWKGLRQLAAMVEGAQLTAPPAAPAP